MDSSINNILRENFNNQPLKFKSIIEEIALDSNIFKLISSDINKSIEKVQLEKKCNYCSNKVSVKIDWENDEFTTLCCDHSLYDDELFTDLLELDFLEINDSIEQQSKNISRDTDHHYNSIHQKGISALYLIYSDYTQKYYDLVKSIAIKDTINFKIILKDEKFISFLKNDYDIFFTTTNPFEVSLKIDDSYFFTELNKILPFSLTLLDYFRISSFEHQNFFTKYKKEDIWDLVFNKEWAIEIINQKIKNKENLYFDPISLIARKFDFSKINNGEFYKLRVNSDSLKKLESCSFENFKNIYENFFEEPIILINAISNLNNSKDGEEKLKFILKRIDLKIKFQNITLFDLVSKLQQELKNEKDKKLLKKIMFMIQCEK